MKKMVSVLLVAVMCTALFASCAVSNENVQDPTITFESGIFPSRDWDASEGSYTKEAVPDEETALRAAQAVFAGMKKTGQESSYVASRLWYDTEKEMWLVSFDYRIFTMDTTLINEIATSIVIRKSDGKVIKIF